MGVNGIAGVGKNAYETLTTTQAETKPVEETKDNASDKGENGVVCTGYLYEMTLDSFVFHPRLGNLRSQ